MNTGGNGSTTGNALVIVSGMSGSGKSVALNTLEDLDFYCVDNLPAELLPDFVRSATHPERASQRLAVGIDVRSRGDLANIPEWLSAVGTMGFDPKLVFFDTTDDVLLKRYADTRRRHPLTRLGLALSDAIALELGGCSRRISLEHPLVGGVQLGIGAFWMQRARHLGSRRGGGGLEPFGSRRRKPRPDGERRGRR